ncbi:MAG: molybdopterin molybdotransferase MoeA [Desulfitobacteriaceae bacterium]|nr:molybdopterin molybdotransferase MoeA [Desulfitobacteriaceae bacterium]MDD4402293.1 molybdopterin molybdotransferase MoeA [Desulfitobacteriaceae bacterium]
MYLDSKSFVSREQALQMLLERWQFKKKSDFVSLQNARGRICTSDIYSKNTLPVYRSSRLDGIAVRFADLEKGMPDTSSWCKGIDYVAADTGDDFDDAFDTVIPIEDVTYLENQQLVIHPAESVKKGQYVSQSGDNIKTGELLVRKGTCLEPVHLGLLASGGITQVEVAHKPLVAFIPTGDELIDAGTPPQRGQNIQSNSIMVEGLLSQWTADFLSYPIIPDKRDDMEDALSDALSKADIIIVNGGSSKGHEDHTGRILLDKASFIQHGIKSIPGIPVAVSIVNEKPVINLPGPPLAAFYAMDWCVCALVFHYLGYPMPKRPEVPVVLQSAIQTPEPFDFYVRLSVVKNQDHYEASVLTWDHRMPALVSGCNAIVIVPIGVSGYQKGQVIKAELLYGLNGVPDK